MKEKIKAKQSVHLGERLEVYIEDKMYYSSVQDVEGTDTLVISPLQSGQRIYYFPPGTTMQVVYCRTDARYLFDAQLMQILRHSETNLSLISIKALSPAHRHQRRENFRVPVLLDGRLWTDGIVKSLDKMGAPIASQRGNTVDLSSGGMRVRLETPPQVGERIFVDFTLDDKPYTLLAKVCRLIPAEERGQNSSVGLQFIQPPNDVVQHIIRYLLNRQAGLRRMDD